MTSKTKELQDEIDNYHNGDSELMAEEMSEKVAELKGRIEALQEVQEIMNNLKYVHPEKFPYDNDEEDMIIDFKELNYEIDKLK